MMMKNNFQYTLSILFFSVLLGCNSQKNPPFRYLKDNIEGEEYTLVSIDGQSETYILLEKLSNVSVGDLKNATFYFFTPYLLDPDSKTVNIDCPNDYGLIALDSENNVLYRQFWSFRDSIGLNGNCLPGIETVNAKAFSKSFLIMGTSGCGSGISATYFEMEYMNGKLNFSERINVGSGFSIVRFNPEKESYTIIERVNPTCHFGCKSRYSFSHYSLRNFKLLNKSVTKYSYDDMNEVELDLIEDKIRIKEPSIKLK
jgi:hypothetical protein